LSSHGRLASPQPKEEAWWYSIVLFSK
jgi:hypothetical protein